MATGDRIDPYAQYNFLIEIDGVARGGFSECSGLDTESDIIEYREGNEQATVRKLPGLKKFTNIKLVRGYTQDKDLWNWRKKTLDGATERRSGSIILRDEGGKEALRWNFREGWPVKWMGPQLNGKTNEAAIETLEIAHEGLELQ
jgi:phage tail-like protein